MAANKSTGEEESQATITNETIRSRSSSTSSSSSWSERISGYIKREWEWIDEASLEGYDENAVDRLKTSLYMLPHITIRGDELGGTISNIMMQQSEIMSCYYERCTNATSSYVDSVQSSTSSAISFLYNNCLQMSSASCGAFSSDSADQYVHKIPSSFAMSGCGWLIPFHLGVIQAFRDAGYINNQTLFAGTSGGAIGALVGCLDIPTEDALNELISLSVNESFKLNIDVGLKAVLKRIVQLRSSYISDLESHENLSCSQSCNSCSYQSLLTVCNERLHVTVTKLWPKPTFVPIVISNFDSEDHLLDVIAASCFIPLYSSPLKMMTNISKVATQTFAPHGNHHSPQTSLDMDLSRHHGIESIGVESTGSETIHDEYYIDGGVLAFIPPVGEVRISPFPSRYIRSFVEADITLPAEEYSLRQLLTWVLYPAPELILRELYSKGQSVARRWIENHERHLMKTQTCPPENARSEKMEEVAAINHEGYRI